MAMIFMLHYLLPFVLLLLVVIHIALLHLCLSSSSLHIAALDLVCFLDFYALVDLFTVYWYVLFFTFMVFFRPFGLFESVNFVEFNTLVTPLHIIPDWFLLYPYACLRSFENKVIGVIALLIMLLSFSYQYLI